MLVEFQVVKQGMAWTGSSHQSRLTSALLSVPVLNSLYSVQDQVEICLPAASGDLGSLLMIAGRGIMGSHLHSDGSKMCTICEPS